MAFLQKCMFILFKAGIDLCITFANQRWKLSVMASKPSRSSMKLCIGRWKISGALDVLKNIRTQ